MGIFNVHKKRAFLGGTCNESKWRKELIDKLEISYFNPVVDDWNEEAQRREEYEKQNCDIRIYCITPEMTGVFTVAEVVDDSNKIPEKTVLCLLRNYGGKEFDEGQWRSLMNVSRMVLSNGAKSCFDLDTLASIVNNM